MRPISGQPTWPDGTQQFAVVHQDVATWSASISYALGAQATGSDGHVYVTKVSGLKGTNPVGDAGAHWQPLW